MSRRRIASLAFVVAGLAAASCTGIAVEQHAAPELPPLRAMGYRIAVVPFTVSATEDDFFADSLAAVGDLLAFESSRELPMREQVGAMLHGDVVAWLQQSDYEVVDPWHVTTQLDHAGIDAAARRDPARAADVARAVGADGIVYGDVRRWNRSYYVLQTVVEVALHLELIDAASGKQLFRTDRAEQIGAGLTGGPTGYVSAATEPIAGLRGSNLRGLARSVARHVAADLNGGELGTEVGPATPRLAVVALAKEHDGAFRVGERVDVIAIGSPDCEVDFALGRMRTEIPMRTSERHDDPRGTRATYLGHYVVASADEATELPLTCTIRRGTARRAVAVRYRWDGQVSLAGNAR
jgi:hypothetical protein